MERRQLLYVITYLMIHQLNAILGTMFVVMHGLS